MLPPWRFLFLAPLTLLALVALVAVPQGGTTHAQATIEPPYDDSYTSADLGTVPGVPTSYGGLTFLAGDPNTLLIGGAANEPSGAIYSIGVARDGSGHVTGFTGSATMFAEAAYDDGGVAYGPGDVLFLARWPENELGQVKPGSAVTDKIVDMSALGVTASLSSLNFIPEGFPGAGKLKLAVYDDGNWYSAAYAADGSGTFNITSATLELSLGDVGPEGFAFVPPGSPAFPPDSILLAEYDSDVVATYRLDANGDPIPASRDVFVSGLEGAEGAAIDPVTGDFLFSTFGDEGAGGNNGDHVVAVRGFAEPAPTPTPLPSPTTTPVGPVVTQGDVDCDGDVDSVDALKDLRHVAALPVSQTQPCIDIGGHYSVSGVPVPTFTPTPGPPTPEPAAFGDVDCDGDVDSVDALKILRHVAALAVSQSEPCADIGTVVSES